jgi:hypothetical protein
MANPSQYITSFGDMEANQMRANIPIRHVM